MKIVKFCKAFSFSTTVLNLNAGNNFIKENIQSTDENVQYTHIDKNEEENEEEDLEENEDINICEKEKEEYLLSKGLLKYIDSTEFFYKNNRKRKKRQRYRECDRKKGNWQCQNCGNINFRFRKVCNVCGIKKSL